MHDVEVRERVARVEQLLAGLDEQALEAVAAVVELYGEALRRVLAFAPPLELLADELVAHLLLAHDLHPESVDTRVARALEEVRPYLGSHGGDVELLGIEGDIARVRLQGTCNGCPSSSATLRHAIEDAVARAAPELAGVEAEGVATPQPQLLQIGGLQCPPELSA
jgi:Fe-S cluster biogenesis protein NfuA